MTDLAKELFAFLSSAVPQALAMTKDILFSMAALSGAIVAWHGLHTWKRQLHGATEYELARRYLRAAYRLRDEFGRFRNPFMSGDEIATAIAEAQVDAPPESEMAHRAAYVHRWNRVADAASGLRLESLEAEVLWGQAARNATRSLEKCASTLNSALTMHLMDRSDRPGDGIGSAARARVRKVIYPESSDPQKDDYSRSVKEAIAKVEELARPYLRR